MAGETLLNQLGNGGERRFSDLPTFLSSFCQCFGDADADDSPVAGTVFSHNKER